MLSLLTGQRDLLQPLHGKDPDPEVRFRAHIILFLGEGRAYSDIERVVFCSGRTIDRRLQRLRAEGAEGLVLRRRGRPFRLIVG